MEVLYSRCAGLDVHKNTVVACVRVAVEGKVHREMRTFDTTTTGLLALSSWLAESGCTHVAMEATGVYWKPVWHILAADGFALNLYPLRPNLTWCDGEGVVSERRHRVSKRGDDTMTRDEKIIRNKVGVLELAKQLGSVSQACRIMGFSRDSFYRFRDLYEKGGEAALIEMSRRVPNPRNRIGETIERRILEMTLEQPAWGHTRMANELAKEGLRVSRTGGRGALVRHDLNTMAKRLKALEARVAQDGLILTESQLAALER